MFERLAAWVLNTYLGEYLENLNTDQLSIDLLQGQMQLENVPFKKTALQKFKMPISVRSGVLGKLTVTIPYYRMRSEPWVVTLNNVDIILEPNQNIDAAESKDNDLNVNSTDTKAMENIPVGIENDLPIEKEAQSSSWWGYAGVSAIVDNIQLIVNSARIRYVDDVAIPGCSFACGIEVERFTIQTTDACWKPSFVVRTSSEAVYKLFQFFGLNLYWDSSPSEDANISSTTSTRCTEKGKFLDEASLDVRLEKRNSSPGDKCSRTIYNVFTRFANVVKLHFDQLQLEHLKSTVQKVSDWYFGESATVDDVNKQTVIGRDTVQKESTPTVVIDKNIDNSCSGNPTDIAVEATFDVPAICVELKNCLGDFEQQPFIVCNGEMLILKYVKDKIHLSHIEASISCLKVKDLLENTPNQPYHLQYLLSTTNSNDDKLTDSQSYLSSSCPELPGSDDSDFVLLSSSLPGALSPSVHAKVMPFSTAPVTPKLSRKTSLRVDPIVHFKVTFIDCLHKDFEKLYNKVQYQIEATFNCLEIVVNQETWVLLFDFFGLLSPSSSSSASAVDIVSEEKLHKNDLKKQIQVKTDTLIILLNKPKERRSFAKLTANGFRANVLTEKAGIEIYGKLNGLLVEDCCSNLYNEKFISRACDKDVEFVLYKYTDQDVVLQREFDAVLSVTVPEKCTYTHSQRFLMEFTSFWLQYVQLQEYYSRARAASLGSKQFDENLVHGFRLKLTANFSESTIVLPEFSTSQNSLIVEAQKLNVNNYFRFSNSQESAKFYDEPDFNCLQDVMEINIFDCGLYVGNLVLVDNEFSRKSVLKSSENLLNKLLTFDVKVVRNLDVSISRCVPDIEIHTSLDSLICQLHLNTYLILRNLLERNFGEDLPQFLNAQSTQFRQNPVTMTVLSGLKWVNLLLQLDMSNVTVNCTTTVPLQNFSENVDLQFGRAVLNDAHLSYESFSDSTKEVDLTCFSGFLIDTRFDNEAANKRRNVFSTIFSPIDLETSSTERKTNIVAEIHYFSNKDVSKFTMLFSLSRLAVVTDWLTTAKNFLLSNAAPSKEASRQMSTNSAALIRSGVATRKSEEEQKIKNDNFELKINLSESEIVFIENTSYKNSLATILKGNAVINYKEHKQWTNFSCNAQSVQLYNCAMDNRVDSMTTLTEPFGLTIELSPQAKKGPSVKLVPVGLLDLANHIVAHKLEINFSNLTAKFSHRDWLVFKTVLDAYSSLWDGDGDDEVDKKNSSKNSFTLEKIETKFSVAYLWLLDDSQDHRMPLIRICLKNAEFDQKPTKLLGDAKEGYGSLYFSVEFFNQNFYGWEPLLEPWKLQNFCWMYSPAMNSLTLDISERNEVLNLNISRIFLDQGTHFASRWPTISQSTSCDFRTSYLRRSDFLPYLLRNESGSRLKFTVEANKLLKDKNQTMKIDWVSVEPDQSASFSFHSLPHDEDRASETLLDKIVVRIDGWHELGAINVDSVGTFFRLARLSENNKNVSGLMATGSTYAYVVIAVTKDNEGRKIITIRSSVLFVNGLPDPLEVHLESFTTHVADTFVFVLQPGCVRSAPLRYTMCRISVRPLMTSSSFGYCKFVSWQHVSTAGQVSDCVRQCSSLEDKQFSYKMCVSVKREHFPDLKKYPEINFGKFVTLPCHTVTFVPPLIVSNLLPVDVKFRLPNIDYEKHVGSGGRLSVTVIDIQQEIEICITIENFYVRESTRFLPAVIQEEKTFYLEMYDNNKRPFVLTVVVVPVKGGGLKMTVSSPFWIVNKSGLPLIFKQEDATEEAAGQFNEHESGKSMLPQIFSFADPNVPKRMILRLGRYVQEKSSPVWSNSFVLESGITKKTLHLQKLDQSPSLLYDVGVEVRLGQGLYKDTRIVMLTPLYTLDNRSSFTLYVAQKCDIEGKQLYNTIASNCSLAWHWSRQDFDMLLCVKRVDLPYWSNGFRIDQLTSFHLTVRDHQLMPHLLRVEIVLHGAMYFVTFLDADTFPPPIRIENLSEVPVLYQQKGCESSHLRTILRQHSEVNYSWDDQLQPKLLVLTVFGNKSVEYDLTVLGQHCPLTYENYFYIAFSATFDKVSGQHLSDDLDLVLDVLPKGTVVLHKKDATKSTQLWRMTADGMLVNVGMQKVEKHHTEILVLDTLSCADPKTYVPLVLNRSDHRRRLTQRWHFTDDGRLMCDLQGLYVQAADRFLKDNIATVLGPTHPVVQFAAGVPPEQWVCKQRQKPGSGSLVVSVSLDGPTRLLRIMDITNPYPAEVTSPRRPQQFLPASTVDCSSNNGSLPFQFCCSFNLERLAFSVITNDYEELLYCQMRGLLLQVRKDRNQYMLSTRVLDLQADNQLVNADRWTLLYIRPKYDEKGEISIPALTVHISWTPSPSYDTFESFVISIGKAALFLDEIFLWKLVLFLEFDPSASSTSALTPSSVVGSKPPNIDVERPDPQKARRCYFDNLLLSCRRLYLSVLTANVLPQQLRRVKQCWNVPLVRFENAPVEIDPFQQMYYFETVNFLLDAIGKHLHQQLTSQAVKILGTVDFLGNPLGLFQDLSGGLRDLFIEGNVAGFVRGVWFGVSNSTAKITSSVSEGVGKISMDEDHRQRREAFRHQSHSVNPFGHFMTGVKGLGFGILGGAISLPHSVYDGVKKDGIVEGLLVGTGKGIVGTFAKPVQGFLDLATGAATAAREIVNVSGPPTAKFPSARLRSPRVTRNVHGTLPPYSASLAIGQEALRVIRNHNNEICLAMHDVNRASTGETLHVLVSSEMVYVIKKRSNSEQDIVLTERYSDLISATSVLDNSRVAFVEFLSRSVTSYSKTGKPKKSLVKCLNFDIASELTRQIMYAKQRYDDHQRCLPIAEDVCVEP